MNIFVLNCGSSSLKFQIIVTDENKIHNDSDEMLAKGLVERIGGDALFTYQVTGKPAVKGTMEMKDHRDALLHAISWITSPETAIPGLNSLQDIHAIGHRLVHGEERFKKSVKIDDEVIAQMEASIDLAPLHNPANLKGITAARDVFGKDLPMVGVFDTSFHTTMPETSYLYGIPYELYTRLKVRRYGFHGTSHRYIAYRYRRLTGKSVDDTNIITLHLGNGSSACAIKNGKSLDTSMGMTPLEGLIMGTRAGDFDTAIIEYIMRKDKITVADAFNMLNKQSGVLGISGISNDMRDLEREMLEHSNQRAKLALDMFAIRIKKYIGSYMAEMNACDAICFTAGIGENSPLIRKMVCENLEYLGVKLDNEKNENAPRGQESLISAADSKVAIYVIPTNEELILARDTFRVVNDLPRVW